MKLSLHSERGAEILAVSGQISEAEVKVLRAGLKKLLATGKHRVVVEMPDAEDLATEVIREIAAFDFLARELTGRVVLAGVLPSLQAKIAAFAKPPVILCFKTRADAIEALAEPPKDEGALPSATPLEPAPGISHVTELNEFRKRIQELEEENRALREQVVVTTIARRAPANEAEYRDKIESLEAKIEKLLTAAAPAVPAG